MLLAAFTWLCLAGYAPLLLARLEPQELGDPFLRNFSPREYGAFLQNWCIVQDPRGLIYVGNNFGVLEYDGVRWRLIRTEKGTGARSLAVSTTGRIYVGAAGEFGYLAPDAKGEMRFISLMDRVEPADRSFLEILSIYCLGDSVYFQSRECLFRITGDTVRVWKPTKFFQMAFTVRSRLYVHEFGRGLLILDSDFLKPLPGGEFFADQNLRALLPWEMPGTEKEGLLIGSQGQCLFLYDGKSVTPFPTQADDALRKAQISHILPCADGSLGIATFQGGFIHIARDGRWLGRVSKGEGLLIDSVKYLFQDSQAGLWMALGVGLSRVEISSPVTCFNDRRGLLGSAFSIHRHLGTLYLGTDQGTFRLIPESPQGPRFLPVQGLKAVTWSFVSRGESLLVANTEGVYEVQGNTVVPVWKSPLTAYHLMMSRKDPARLYIGLQNSITSCRLEGGHWVDEGVIPDLNIQARSFHETEDGGLWVGTFTQGVIHLSFPEGRQGKPRVERFGTDRGLPSLKQTYVHWLAGGLKVSSHSGIYRYREDLDRFEPDPAFAGLFPAGQRWVYALKEDRQGRIWMHSCDEVKGINESGAAVPQPGGSYRWEGQPCIRFSGGWVESILAEDDGIIWFGGSEGLFRLDFSVANHYGQPFRTLVRNVSVGSGRSIFGGTWPGTPAEPRIPYVDNRIRFEYAAPSFDLESANSYQIFMEGYDKDWSAWSGETFRDFSNLAEGSYCFRVRARNIYGTLGSEDVYAFQILSPWYRTWWAYIFWIIVGLAALVSIIYLYTLKLRREKVHLENIVSERTQQLREASLTDPLTGLRNRRFILEVLQNDISAFIGLKNYQLNAKNQRGNGLEDTVFGLFLMDIDFFKKVNDTYGHDAGDRVLKQFATILSGSVRLDDAVMRVGGEEFLVMLKKTAPEYIHVFAAKILKKVATTPFDIGGGTTIQKTCSIGYTSFPFYKGQPGLLTFEQSIMVADLGLFHAKNHGRNQGICLKAGSRIPSGEEIIQKTVTSLEFALQEGYLQIDEPTI
jgi:diguanylate cyclase (GGDEF)-like protein